MLDTTDGAGSTELTKTEKRILGFLFRGGARTQSAVADFMELRQQSVSRLLSNLGKAGYLQDGPKVPSGKRGYPAASYELAPEFAYSIGISVMSDAVALAIIDFAGNVVDQQKRAFHSMPVERVVTWVQSELAAPRHSELHGTSAVAGLGVGVAGSFIGNEVGFNTPFYLDEWNGIDVESRLSEDFGMPVWADNDGNVAALGESMIGVGKWANSFAYINISAGVGGGIILDGELWRGKHGNAGEFAGGLPSNIYPFPNLELLRQLVAASDVQFESVNDLVENFDADWRAIDDWIARVRDSLSIIASNATAILDLDAVVLGGRIPRELAERIIPHIELFDQKRRSLDRPTAKLVPAEAKGFASAVGAAMLPLKNTYFL